MKLVLREYISMLRESGELDELVPDLLLNMGIVPLSRAQVGVRQYGVDVPGVGPDPGDDIEKLFLITIKKGDIERNNWDGSPQDVRPSLNEMRDVYLQNRVADEYSDLPVKIVLCSGGDMKQNVEPNWNGYVENNAEDGEIEFDFWGADRLAALIDEYFLDEYLISGSARKQIRKTIALADQNEGEPNYFYAFVEDTLFDREVPTDDDAAHQRERRCIFRLLNLALNIVFHWSQEVDNLRPAVLCSERILLRAWDWMRKNDLLDKDDVIEEYHSLLRTHAKILSAYGLKIQPHCYVEDGLFRAGPSDGIEYPIRTFEVIGIMAEMVLVSGLFFPIVQDDEEMEEVLVEQIMASGHALAALIKNNPSACTPLFDHHIIDITLGLLALRTAGFEEEAKQWLEELGWRLIFAYRIGQHFPIWTDSFEDLVELNYGGGESKEELTEISTLIPILAEWYAAFGMEEEYVSFRHQASEVFDHSTFQIWYPDDSTDNELYRANAGFRSGNTLHSITLPESIEGLRDQISQAREASSAPDTLSCFNHGFSILALVSSRHFRTPVLPIFWESFVLANGAANEEVEPQDDSEGEQD